MSAVPDEASPGYNPGRMEPEPESVKGECVRCERAATARCDLCQGRVCDEHIQHGRGAARQVFGPMLFRSISVVCDICYRERFWLAARGGIACVAAMLGLLSVIEQDCILAIIVVSVSAIWWLIAGHCLRLARSERVGSARRDEP